MCDLTHCTTRDQASAHIVACNDPILIEAFLDIDQEQIFKHHEAHNEFHNLEDCVGTRHKNLI